MSRSRSAGVLAAVLLVITVLLGGGVALHGPVPREVVALLGGPVRRLATVQVGIAVLVPPLLVAVIAAVRATGRLERTAVVWALGAAAPIVLFLVARLNGAADAAALILVYACSAGGVLLRSLQRPGGDPSPIRWSAVLGIVPWGVVAFTQVGGGLTGTPPEIGVRVLTLVVLAASIAEYVVAYRRRDDHAASTTGLALVALPAVLLGVLVLALEG